MAYRQRTPTFRPQLSMRRVYDNLQPRSETKDAPEAYLLHVYIPGFPRDSVRITYVAPSRTLRVTGERQIQGTRWVRFDQSYPVPDYCEPEALQAKFETPVLTLTMPKKKTSQPAPKQEVETTQEKGIAREAKPDEKGQETIPPQTTGTTTKVEEPIEDKKSATPPRQEKANLEDSPSQIPSEPVKPQKGQEQTIEGEQTIGKLGAAVTSKPLVSKTELKLKPTPPGATTMQTKEKPEKGQEEVESKSAPAMLIKTKTAEKPQKGEEDVESKSTPTMLTKVKTAEKPQKVQEEFEPRPTPTMLTKVKTAEKPQKGQEEFEPKPTQTMAPKIRTDDEPEKGQDEVEPKDTTTNVTRKLTVKEQLEEKKTEGTSAEDLEKERISKTEVKEEPSDSRKLMKDKEQSNSEEEETKRKRLVNGYMARKAEPFAPMKKKEGKSEENATDWVGSVSQVVSKIAEGIWNDDEKKLAANVGAAVLVIATLGAYVSYRFVSWGRT